MDDLISIVEIKGITAGIRVEPLYLVGSNPAVNCYNLVENSVRPVALGRKNYLFAGSHEAAQKAAMMYSFFYVLPKK